MKKRGFGAGKFNGFGGKVELGESITQCAQREIEEEAGIRSLKYCIFFFPRLIFNYRVLDAERRGVLTFDFEGNEQKLEVHVFLANQYNGFHHIYCCMLQSLS